MPAGTTHIGEYRLKDRTLDDGAVEERWLLLISAREMVHYDVGGTRASTKEGDVIGITTELGDVVM
jgi:hypothetical protein